MVTTMAELNVSDRNDEMVIHLIFICIYGIVVNIFIKVVVLADFLFRVTETIKIDITCKSDKNDHTCSNEKW